MAKLRNEAAREASIKTSAGAATEAEEGAFTEGTVLLPEGAVAPVGALPDAVGPPADVGLALPVGAVLLLPDGETDAVGDPATGAATGAATGPADGAGRAGRIKHV